MKRRQIFSLIVVGILMTMSAIYYKNLYNRQINYMVSLLDHQVQIVGASIDNTNNNFLSDLNRISFMDDLALFFSDDEKQNNATENIKLFYSEYESFVSGIKIFDNNRNEFSIRKDEDSGEWLQQQFILHVQGEIAERERMDHENNRYVYYLPVIKDNEAIANVAVTIDYTKYFGSVLATFDMEDYEWQWVMDENGVIIFKNSPLTVEYERIDYITNALLEGSVGNLRHNANIDGEVKRLISSYYPTQLLQRELAIIFSSPTQTFHSYIMINSVIIISVTILLVLLIIFVYSRYEKKQEAEINRLASSEKMMFRMIDEMPVGIIIYDNGRRILKANNLAADYYSYDDGGEMKGGVFPEMSFEDVPEYYSKYLGKVFSPEKLIIIKKEESELILIRDTFPVVFMGEDATMEILNDITPIEAARLKETEANNIKTDFITRISFELRGPLNGIIGITDLLSKYKLSDEVLGIVTLLRQSSEHFMNILNEILDFSKIQTGKMVLDVVPFDLKDEIDFGVNYIKAFVESMEGIGFEYDIDKNIPEKIISDPFRIRQVFTIFANIVLRNTVEGKISFSCKILSNKDGLVNLLFELRDTGRSFSRDELDAMFEDPVVRDIRVVDKSNDSVFANILARRLVEKMGGQFRIESPSGLEAEKGLKISFTLTAYSNDRIEKHYKEKEFSSMDGIKTLVLKYANVRDEESIGLLHKLGLDVSVTTYNNNTINLIKTNSKQRVGRYDLIVIFDYESFSGFDIAKTIWENNLAGEFALLVISSNDQPGNLLHCISLGVDHYLAKPFDENKLEATIKECFPLFRTDSKKIKRVENSNINVLMVEDNKITQEVMGAILKNLGCSYDTADDGEEGYQKVLDKRYDIIFMDLFMPVMNGFDSAKEIMENNKSAIIVAITADNMPETIKKAEESGIRSVIFKPVRVEDIENILDKYFRTHQG